MSMGIHNTVSEGVNRIGNEIQRKAFLPDLMSGSKLAAFSLTEPSSGSDAKTMKTRATRSGKDYVFQGSKTFITNAGEADLYLVFSSASAGPSAFIVESRAEGVGFGEDIPKLGMKGSRTSEVFFRDCRVPAANLIGEEGKGFEYAKEMLNSSRVVMAAICVGIAQHAYDTAIRYSVERRISGNSVSEFQITKEKISDMIMEINAARHLYLTAARLREMDSDYSSEAAQAKLFATEASARVCDRAIQIFGGYGYTNPDIHRHWRDARLLTIGEGTSEILRLLVARKELAKLR
jgi:butyryl-CoA dehydrogenase